jgi:hypothetical protein
VDLGHVRRQRGVDHPVPLQQPLPLELVRDHLDLVARAAPSHQSNNHIKTNNRRSLEERKDKFRKIVWAAYPPDVSVTT